MSDPAPEVASLVVLPFANVSGDAEQEYFADGMTEDLIAEFARMPELLVIGRGTSFTCKGRSVAARELGDVFALQDEVVAGIVAGLGRALDAAITHTPRESAAKPDAWALLAQGRMQIGARISSCAPRRC